MTDYDTLRQAALMLREQAALRFDRNGPLDPRGAALWDAGCWIDPDDDNALNVTQETA